ncbi:MAG: aldehyde ferredoxin oxidoreductase C-terminal domain-containing protein, partial [Leptospiraceae bacterium]|nr:aldehyde ferredoxin oxidoreductase C-terminal domain-containing protein [Leptospiraceae bacterium]
LGLLATLYGRSNKYIRELLLSGCYITGTELGLRRIPHVKKQAIPAYDPRVFKGMGVTYVTSPMGADHTAGIVLPGKVGFGYDFLSSVGQFDLSLKAQVESAVLDTLGLCLFASNFKGFHEIVNECVSFLASGEEKVEFQDIFDRLGRDVLEIEKAFNVSAGLKEKEELPSFFYEEVHPEMKTVFDVQGF